MNNPPYTKFDNSSAARQTTDTGHYPFQPLRDGVQLQYSQQ